MVIISKQLQLQVTILKINNLLTIAWFQLFISNANNFYNEMISINYSYLISLQTVIQFQVFLSNINNFQTNASDFRRNLKILGQNGDRG